MKVKPFDKKVFENDIKGIIKAAKNSDYPTIDDALSDLAEDYINNSPHDIVYLASLIDYLKKKGIDESKIDPRDTMVVDNFNTLDFLAGKAIEAVYLYCLSKIEKR
jgi:hypothetical protein